MKLIHKPFLFIRHGETDANARGIICGHTDFPLNSLGAQQAESLAPLMRSFSNHKVYTSPLIRARETASRALPGSNAIVLHQLAERHWGVLEMAPLSELCPYESQPAGGESWDEFKQRALAGLNYALANDGTPIVVAHSGIFRVLNSLLLGTPYGPRLGNANAVLFSPPSIDHANWQLLRFPNTAL